MYVTASISILVSLFFSSICPGSSYELRWFSLLPKSQWDNKYYTPVGDSHDDQDYSFVRAFIYNPGATEITVRWRKGGSQSGSCVQPSSPNDHEYCSGTKRIGQKSTGSIELYDYDNTMTGYEFYTDSATDDFFGVVVVDTRSNWQAFDWGHSLIPESQLSSQIIIGDGRRCDGSQTSGNCDSYGINYVWITPVASAKIWVSYSGETPTSVANDFPALSTFRFGGVDRDLSGAYIFATEPDAQPDGPPVDFAAVWGQEPYQSSSGSTAQSLQLDMVSKKRSVPTLEKHQPFQPLFYILLNVIFVIFVNRCLLQGTWQKGVAILQVLKTCVHDDLDDRCDVTPGDRFDCTIKVSEISLRQTILY